MIQAIVLQDIDMNIFKGKRIEELTQADRYFMSTGRCYEHRQSRDRNCLYCQKTRKERQEIITNETTGY